MTRTRPEKKREPTAPAASRVLPMELRVGDRLVDETGDWEVISRPYTTAEREGRPRRVRRVGTPRRHRDPGLARARARQREANDCRGGQAMIRLGRRALLLAAFSLLTSAATACAECAWVLWQQEGEISRAGGSSPGRTGRFRTNCPAKRVAFHHESRGSHDHRTWPRSGLQVPSRHRGPARAEGEEVSAVRRR